MSYCAIRTFKKGKAADFYEFRNAWGGAMYIWDAIYDKYLKREEIDYVLLNTDRLWLLSQDKRLRKFERAVLASTYDSVIIHRKDFPTYTEDLNNFLGTYPPPGDIVCHLADWGLRIRILEADIEAIAFHGNSVCEDPWLVCDDEKDEYEPYDLTVGDKHWDLYEHVNEGKHAEQAV